ncbi:DUF4225 domain-containing protein [Pseudomonas fakonensis]|uniref:DUF4225 domain-containing protein n=1 Tax=Pseudomonas fakonensis TaxID=2842355 RepID=A0ABX8N303_9PSED|nr:DUF4225 domain-containing protein [Pseudomonas fakonensis]QXH50689.1 DUF4225 domain-containing protein [Pseudomonas fakonensis]
MSARQGNYPLGPDYWEVNQAATRLTAYACSVSARHLRHGMGRVMFNREVAYFAKQVADKVALGELSPEDGLKVLRAEEVSLWEQAERLGRRAVGLAVGLAGGVSQVATGAGACATGPGLCSYFGAPVFAHGVNNIYENGNNLWNGRDDTVGPIRKGYQEAAKKLGYGEREGNLAYYSADLGMAGYGVFFRKPLKPGAWRLYKYHDIDRVRAFRLMGVSTLFFEGAVSGITVYQMIVEYFKK